MRAVIDALAVVGLLSLVAGGSLIGWCLLNAAADRREGRRLVARQHEPEIDDAVDMVKGWTPAPPVRRAPRNIPRGDAGAFNADGLDEAIRQIMKEGR